MEEALELIGSREDRRPYAGGTELLLLLKLGVAAITELIDLKRLSIDGIAEETGSVRIGACATHDQIARSDLVTKSVPALAIAASEVGNVRVRATGTIGGNLCFAEPSSDIGCVLLLTDAELELRSRRAARTVPIGEFFVHALTTVMAEDELLLSIRIPTPSDRRVSAARYHRIAIGERPAAGVGVSLDLDRDGRIRRARVAIGAAHSHPIRLTETESQLVGLDLRTARDAVEDVAKQAAAASQPVGDVHASADYKRRLVAVLARRSMAGVLDRLEAELR